MNLRLEWVVMGLVSMLLLGGCASQSSVTANQETGRLRALPASDDIRSVEVPGFMQDMLEVSLHVTMQTLGYAHHAMANRIYIQAPNTSSWM